MKMKKSEALIHWRNLETGRNPLAVMRPIPYKTEGRKYGCDGVRIDGSPAFIDAVLACLKPMLDGENHVTRLELSRNMANTDFKANPNADRDAEVCYIRLHMRGHEGRIASGIFDRHLDNATDRFAEMV